MPPSASRRSSSGHGRRSSTAGGRMRRGSLRPRKIVRHVRMVGRHGGMPPLCHPWARDRELRLTLMPRQRRTPRLMTCRMWRPP